MDAVNYFNNLTGDARADFLAASLTLDSDKYDQRGRNISAQQRRQKLIPWTLVDRQPEKVEEPSLPKHSHEQSSLDFD
jgi:hypothetical protein